MSTDNRRSDGDFDREFHEADISASLDAQVDAEVARIEARTDHATLALREEDVFGKGGEPTVSAICYQGDERASLSVYMGLDRDSYASVGLDADGCREIAAQLLRCAEELEAAEE